MDCCIDSEGQLHCIVATKINVFLPVFSKDIALYLDLQVTTTH